MRTVRHEKRKHCRCSLVTFWQRRYTHSCLWQVGSLSAKRPYSVSGANGFNTCGKYGSACSRGGSLPTRLRSSVPTSGSTRTSPARTLSSPCCSGPSAPGTSSSATRPVHTSTCKPPPQVHGWVGRQCSAACLGCRTLVQAGGSGLGMVPVQVGQHLAEVLPSLDELHPRHGAKGSPLHELLPVHLAATG